MTVVIRNANTVSKVAFEAVPSVVYFDITPRCSCTFRCVYDRPPDCTLGNIKQILSELARAGVKNIVFRGDVDFREDIPQIIEYALKLGLKVSFKIEGDVFKIVGNDKEKISFLIGEISSQAQLSDLDPSGPVCGAGIVSCHITPCGEVTPCATLPIKCGNLKISGFLDIWKYACGMQMFRAQDVKGCGGCKEV